MGHRLNHDVIANIFSQLKDRGGLNDHLTPLDAFYRLKINLFYEKTLSNIKSNQSTGEEENSENS